MAIPTFARVNEFEFGSDRATPSASADLIQAPASAVSWGAIFAGAAAAALSLVLLFLGTGLGLSAVSPWTNAGLSASKLGLSTIAWLCLTQVAASGLGGYLAGRLRTKWVATHTDEVYFRDTAHGLLTWAVASLAAAALLTSVIASIVSGGAQSSAAIAGATTAAAMSSGSDLAKSDGNWPVDYLVDSLFRKDASAVAAGSANPENDALAGNSAQPSSARTLEVGRIFANTIRTGPLPIEDGRYLGQIVAQHTGLTQQEAEKRVTDTYVRAQTTLRDMETTAKDAADKARQASSYAVLWLVVSMFIGAFVASVAAIFGGRRRDS